MGKINVEPTFVEIMTNMKKLEKRITKECKLKNVEENC